MEYKVNTKDKIIFIGIVLLGLFLRVLFIDKPTGFWHNEMVMYNQAIAGFPLGIIKAAVNADVHFPLYQLFLAVWMKIFSNSDIAIRLFSVFLGTLTIIAGFFAGREAKDAKLGNIFAFLIAINSVLIFYSQEVKFYIMLTLLAAVSLFAIIRIKNKNDIVGHIFYILANTAIVYTFTIGVFYVIAQFISFLSFILLKDKKILKKFLISNAVVLLCILPFVTYILVNFSKYRGASWIFTSNIYTAFVLIQNYFSPVLIGIYNNPVGYKFSFGILPIIFIYIPVILALCGIFYSIKKDRSNLFILLISLLFLIEEVILCANSGLRILTRYTILAVIPLLFLVATGFYSFKSRVLKAIIILYLLIINVFFLISSPDSAVRGYRDLGQKPMADLLIENEINDNDSIVLALRKNDFDKYLKFNGHKFSMLQDFVYKPYAYDTTKPNKYEAFRNFIFDKGNVNKEYEKYFIKTVINPTQKGSKIFLIWDHNYDYYPFLDTKKYKEYPIMTLSLSKMNADTLRICQKKLKFLKGYQSKYYDLFIFKK